jgi:hypothetical protein
MTRGQASWWKRVAPSLSRAGFLWLALTAVTLGSLVSSGTGLAASARLLAASSIGATGKPKANGSGAPTVIPGELTHRALGPDSPEAKRVHAGATPVGLSPAAFVLFDPGSADRLAIATDLVVPDFKPGAFQARAPPA